MRIHAVTPIHVGVEELARRQRRYDRLAPAGIELTLHDLGPDAPRALDTDEDVARSDAAVAAALRSADPAAADVVLADCVLDPGIDATGHLVPAVGLLRLAAGHLHALDQPFGCVTRNPAIAAELDRRLAGYGYDDLVCGHEILDLDFDAVAEGPAWNDALRAAARRLGAAGATAVLNGCSAVEIAEGADGPALVDPTALALELLGAVVRAMEPGAAPTVAAGQRPA